jgi:serine/threonine-protein kinase HipA
MTGEFQFDFFDLHVALNAGKSIVAGNLAVKVDQRGRIVASQFKYTQEFLASGEAFPLSPIGPSLNQGVFTYESSGRDFPGFIDDILPDDWGRKIIATRLRVRFVDTMTVLKYIGQGVSTGAYRLTPRGGTPNWELGISYQRAERLAEDIYSGQIEKLGNQAGDIALLLKGGSGTGGARPKLLVTDDQGAHILKLNKKTDEFNMAAIEWASLEVMRVSGLDVAEAKLTKFAHSIEGIMVKRFDITDDGGHIPMVTINGLLKNTADQEDPLYGTYEDIANCIRQHSFQPENDLMQLLGQLMINQALANTDDHLRNFSMIKLEKGWKLSPAYDVLSQQLFSTEHAIGFNGSVYLPKLEDGIATGKTLGVSPKKAEIVMNNIKRGLSEWPSILMKAGVDDQAFISLVQKTQGKND